MLVGCVPMPVGLPRGCLPRGGLPRPSHGLRSSGLQLLWRQRLHQRTFAFPEPRQFGRAEKAMPRLPPLEYEKGETRKMPLASPSVEDDEVEKLLQATTVGLSSCA